MILQNHTTLDNCYCSFVNLRHRKDRYAHMLNELSRIGLQAKRFEAIDTSISINSVNVNPVRVKKMLMRTPGAIGCHFSQVAVMQAAHSAGKHAFVMEDDLVFCGDFLRRIYYIDRFLESHEWDVFWLGGTYHINPAVWHTGTHPDMRESNIGRDAELTEDPRILRTYGAFSTYAYIVNLSSIPKIIAMLDNKINESIGIDYLFIMLQPYLMTYAFAPGCVKQMDNQSNIGNGMTFFSHFNKLGAHWFADRMEDFDPTKYEWAEASHLKFQ